MLGVLVRRLLRACYRIRIEGDGALLSASQPMLIVANHPRMLDPALVVCALPLDAVVIVSRQSMQSLWVRLALAGRESIVADLSEAQMLRRIARIISRGRSCIVFPENRPTRLGAPSKLYEAPAIVAARTGVPVLALNIRYGPTTLGRRAHRGVTLTLASAERISLPPGLSAKERRRKATDQLLSIMQRLSVAALAKQTLFEAFVDALDRYGRRTRIIEDVRLHEESYASLLKTCLALGRLIAAVSREGEIVGVLLPNTIATVGTVLGLSAMRRIPAMLNYSAGPKQVHSAIQCAGIGTVITSRRFVEAAHLERLLRVLSACKVYYLEDLRAQLSFGNKLWIMGRALWRPRAAVPPSDPDGLALVLFTSGSEGTPKGVGLSHRAALANMAQLASAIDFDSSHKFLNALPMYHTYGLIACTLMPILYGTRLFLYTNPLHYRVIPEIAYARDCTYLFGTSTFLSRYAQHARPVDFSTLHYVVSGGEKLSPEVSRIYRDEFGVRVLEGYGSTECGPAIALNTPQRYRLGTVGRLLPGVEHRVVPVAGIARGGMLHVRSPNLMLGYFLNDRPGELQPVVSELGGGWHAMGDIVDIDEDGFVTVLGRLKRFAKVAGEMVALDLVERVARECSPQHQHAAAVAASAERGETTVLFTTDAALDRLRLHQCARQLGIQDLAVARHIKHVDALPVLGTGKTDYVALAEYASGVSNESAMAGIEVLDQSKQ